MLEIKNLKVCYDDVLAISDVNLSVESGKIVALVGGNGNGKSTTLRAVAGLNATAAGSINFNGEAIHHMPAHKRVPLGLSLVPEGRRLFPQLTVLRNLELGAFTRSDKYEVASGIEEMLDLFPILKERVAQLAGTMSGGEQQMLAIARGLMVNQTGVSILLVEQNLQKALNIAHYGYVIQTGRIVMQGLGQDLLHNDQIKKAYLGL
jgi:branched-chain amino acid transport system ATP-binding protein